jgi:UPF0755 protein
MLKMKNKILVIFSIFVYLGIPVIGKAQDIVATPQPAVTVSPIVQDKFVVPLNSTQDTIVQSLSDQNYIKDRDSFMAIFSKKKGDILPGAYKITTSMTVEKISAMLHGKPYMKWIVIPPGLRKEEIAELLATNLGWTKTQKNKWINVYTKIKYDYIEGVYFPDTYLIPVTETPQNVAKRLTAKFNEKFAPYLLQFNKINMQWTKGLTLASLVQREAANVSDMPLVAGILLNRLNQKIPLGVDATLQYLRGNKGKGWWASVSVVDKKTVSSYNTYKNIGLPPHPISNPGLEAIAAVLNPTKTDCLYYLHDKEGNIHCSITYTEHQANIEKYLKQN